MKRLLDDEPHAFERTLLRVGADVQSDGSGKARLLSALAAGTIGAASGVGLGHVSSAPAWKVFVTTKLAKATVIGVLAAGSGSALWAVQRQASERNELTTPSNPGAATSAALRASAVEPLVRSPLRAAIPDIDVTPRANSASRENSSVATRDDHAQRLQTTAPVATSSPRAVGVHPKGAISDEPSTLLAEARFVERLRGAIRDEDEALVTQLLTQYRHLFPNGQLRPEVSKLDAQWRGR